MADALVCECGKPLHKHSVGSWSGKVYCSPSHTQEFKLRKPVTKPSSKPEGEQFPDGYKEE